MSDRIRWRLKLHLMCIPLSRGALGHGVHLECAKLMPYDPARGYAMNVVHLEPGYLHKHSLYERVCLRRWAPDVDLERVKVKQ